MEGLVQYFLQHFICPICMIHTFSNFPLCCGFTPVSQQSNGIKISAFALSLNLTKKQRKEIRFISCYFLGGKEFLEGI